MAAKKKKRTASKAAKPRSGAKKLRSKTKKSAPKTVAKKAKNVIKAVVQGAVAGALQGALDAGTKETGLLPDEGTDSKAEARKSRNGSTQRTGDSKKLRDK